VFPASLHQFGDERPLLFDATDPLDRESQDLALFVHALHDRVVIGLAHGTWNQGESGDTINTVRHSLCGAS
jgi:hypothetical protein